MLAAGCSGVAFDSARVFEAPVVETYRLRNVFEGFRETVRFPSGIKVLDKPQGTLSCMRLKKPLVFQRFLMFPLRIQGGAA